MSSLVLAKKRKIIMEVNEKNEDVSGHDRISKLPTEVLHSILMYLPMKQAVKTSTLSKRWRYLWSSIPQLVVDGRWKTKDGKNNFVEFTNMLLLLHDGPITTFHATSKARCNGPIARWLLNLSRNSVQNLFLRLGSDVEKWDVPSALFSCAQLKFLMLSYGIMRLPDCFKGFDSLRSIVIHHVAFRNAGDLNALVSSCPMLETLDVRKFKGCSSLEIHAPKLKMLCIRGLFQDLQLATPNLLYAFIYRLKIPEKMKAAATMDRKATSLVQLFDGMPQIEKLSMGGEFIKNLAAGFVPEMLPMILCHLRKLYFSFNLSAKEETNVALCILRSAPNVQEIELTIRTKKEGDQGGVEPLPLLWDSDLFESIEVMRVNCSLRSEPALDLAKLALGGAPLLSKMVIMDTDEGETDSGSAEAFKSLMQFPRASRKADVVLKKGSPEPFLPPVPKVDSLRPFGEAELREMQLHNTDF